jgi:hypothetical protein
MKKFVAALSLALALSSPALAGVVIELESRDLVADQATPSHKIFADGEMLRMEVQGGEDQDTTMIFRDNVIYIVNHRDKSYFKLDEAMLEELGSQVSQAMKMMEEKLAQLPPEQRAMVEKMMQGQMGAQMQGGMLGGAPQPQRIEAEGSQKVESYSCKKYGVYRGTEKTSEILVAPADEVGAAAEALDAIRAMARFSETMLESFKDSPLAGMVDNPYQVLSEIDGFPVVTREFEGGRATEETVLKSANRESLDAGLFKPPADYKEKDPLAGAKR